MAVQFPYNIDIRFETPFANQTLTQQNLQTWSPDWGNNLTPPSTMPPTWQWYYNNTKQQTTSQQPTQQSKQWSVPVSQAASAAIDAGSNYLSNQIMGNLNDSELGRNLGAIFSSGISSAGNTLSNNLIKGQSLTTGLANNVGASVAGAGAGIAANYIGKGINSLGGDTMLSRGIGQGVATGLGSLGGQAVSNLLNGNKAFQEINDSFKAIKSYKDASKVAGFLKDSPEAVELAKLSKAAKWNLAGIGASIVGSGLQAAFGPSKEYNGRYGNITRTMDSVYDTVQAGVGFIPGAGTVISGAMALNKGLSNIFGSTSGMTKTDAILGSAFMPAPVKWLNMAGASTTGNFYNQSWQNMEKTNSFMGNAFGNLRDRFDNAREEAGKTYGTFSQGAKNRAQDNINFANQAWTKINSMADQNEIQNIRSQYMTSINNQRYAQEIGGVWQPIYRGKQGMKIFNNATNHNIGMRLLSAAALIDNKQMILSAQGGTKVRRPLKPMPKKPATREENPELWDEWERIEAERNASKQRVYNQQKEAATQRAETNTRHAQHYSNLATGVAETTQQNAEFEPVTQESLQNSNTEQVRQEQLADKNEYFDKGMDFINAAGLADLAVSAAPLLQRGFRWAFNKAGQLVKVPANRFTVDGNISSIENTQKFIPNFSKMTLNEKLQWLKTQQELAYKVDQARTLDALHMTKTRVKQGGAKRLDDAFSNDMYSSPEESIFSENLKLGYTTDELEKMAMEKNLLENVEKKPIKGTAEQISNKMNDAGISDRLTMEDGAVAYRNKLYTDVPSDAGFDLKGFRKGLKGAAHEFVHFLYQPISKPRGMNFPKGYIGDYLSGEGPVFETTGATEVSARGTQIKNYFGLKEGEQITPEMWNYAARHYMKDVGDNDMSTMFKFANTTSQEFPYVLKWINKHAPAVIPSIIGGSTAATLYNTNK